MVNSTTLSGNAILDAVQLALNFGQLIYTFLTSVALIYPIALPIFGANAAGMLSAIWYFIMAIGLVKVITGRLSWG
jgi:hypothetical protein